MGLASITLYYWFFRFEFFPIYFEVFDEPNVVYSSESGPGGKGDSVQRVPCMGGDFGTVNWA